MKWETLTRKKRSLDAMALLPAALTGNLEQWFAVELTYTSNAIEGNTLTRRETAVVIEKGLTVGGKSMREHLEAANHARALEFVRTRASSKPSTVTAKDILAIHGLILKGIDDDNAGTYRSVPVRIAGSSVVLPNPRKVSALMDEFEAWLGVRNKLHPAAFAAEAHYRLVSIHPFVDGNGRAARLLMNLLLLQRGYPPAIIRKKDRLAYIGALEKAQLGGSKDAYERIVYKAVDRSLDIYLKAARGKTAFHGDDDSGELLKIGELAKAAGQTVPTIRYWTHEGLLDVAEVTESGYTMYAPEMVGRCESIKKLKAQRLTLAEIKARMK